VTACPLWLICAFQPDVICCVPLNDHAAVHEVTAGPLFVIPTVAVNPPLHWLTW
jgi:hypothetical protein